MKLRMIDTFSGIGGFSLAARWLGGIETVQFVEREQYCQQILHKHWPNVPIHDDICTFNPAPGSADIVCGGFPCQDISTAGKQAGIKEGTRSGLFYELMRVVRLVGPRYIVLENVAAITSNGLDAVLGTLAEAGFDAEWACIPAADVGACHRRDRWWCVAYATGGAGQQRQSGQAQHIGTGSGSKLPVAQLGDSCSSSLPAAYANSSDRQWRAEGSGRRERSAADAGGCGIPESSGSANSAAYATCEQRHDCGPANSAEQAKAAAEFGDGSGAGDVGPAIRAEMLECRRWRPTPNANNQGPQGQAITWLQGEIIWPAPPKRLNPDWRSYLSEPVLRRGDDGLSGRVDRLKALGNAVVPQVAAIPLARVLELERVRAADPATHPPDMQHW
jgi:DNA (cytosine-5)-methyltransferase 1